MKANNMATILLIVVSSIFSSCSSEKYGYVNPQKLIANYHGTAEIKQQLKKDVEQLQANIDSLTAEAAQGSTAMRARKQQVLLRYQDEAQRKVLAQERALNEVLLKDINGYIKDFGKSKGYRFIFAATEQGNIVYAAEGTDITEDVLDGLNARYDQQHVRTH